MPVKNRNLRLAIVASMLEEGLLKLPRTRSGKYGEYDKFAAKEIAALPLSEESLRRLERLVWDVSNRVIERVFPGFDGEDDEFAMDSFIGIGRCTNLRAVEIHMFGGSSLAGLDALSLLETVVLRTPYSNSEVDDLSPLLGLKSLRYAEIERVTSIPRSQIASLLASGVELKLGRRRYSPKENARLAPSAPEDFRALEREAERLLQEDQHRQRLEVLKRALQIREKLAAEGKLSPGAEGKPIRSGIRGGVAFSKESNVLAGVALVASAIERVGSKDALSKLRVRMGEMIEAASRRDAEAIEKLISWGTEASQRGRMEDGRTLLTFALSAAKRSRDRSRIKEAEKELELHNVRSGPPGGEKATSLRALAKVEARATEEVLSLVSSSSLYSVPAARRRDVVELCRKAYEMRCALAEAGQLSRGATGMPAKRVGNQLPFGAESNVLGGLVRLCVALRAAKRKKEADALAFEACDMIVDAKRVDEDAILFLVGGMQDAASGKNMARAWRYATAIESVEGDSSWLVTARKSAAKIKSA